MQVQLLPNGNLRVDYEEYQPWPNFHPTKSVYLGGLWRAHFLREILTSDDLVYAAWREPIPTDVLRALQHYPECHCELIEMAQSVPEYFLGITRRNPALAMIAATFWQFRNFSCVPEKERKVVFWENMDPDDILQFCRFPTTRSFLKALAKMPPGHVHIHRIEGLRDLWMQPEKRKLLRHLPAITGENIWLLSCFPPVLDPAIHQLATREPNFGEYSILEVVSDLSNRRELAGLHHWPYHNQLDSWPRLLVAYDRFFRDTNCLPETLPVPPINGLTCDEIEIEPLRSRTALRREAKEMRNCIETFDASIFQLKHYAYRLIRPERATVLLKCQYNRWIIEEAMIASNERVVTSETMKLLCQWLKEQRRAEN
jgi:hypothetical protein